jgi:hypothetical protein
MPRMSQMGKKASWPWVMALLIGLTILYCTSFWPVSSLIGNGCGHERIAATAFYPLLVATITLPKSVRDRIFPEGGDAAEGVIIMGLSVRLLDFHSRPW